MFWLANGTVFIMLTLLTLGANKSSSPWLRTANNSHARTWEDHFRRGQVAILAGVLERSQRFRNLHANTAFELLRYWSRLLKITKLLPLLALLPVMQSSIAAMASQPRWYTPRSKRNAAFSTGPRRSCSR